MPEEFLLYPTDFIYIFSFDKSKNMLYSFNYRCQQIIRIIIVRSQIKFEKNSKGNS